MAITSRGAHPATGAYGPSALPAIGYKLASAAMLACMFALIKSLGGTYPVGQIVFARSVFALLLVLWLVHMDAGWQMLRTQRLWAHVQRSVAGLCSLFLSFTAVAMLPLGIATALGYTAPLFITILAIPLLAEPVRTSRWGVTALGLIGMLLVIHPGAGEISPGVGVALAGAIATAIALISIRKLADTESGIAIVFYFALSGTVVSAATLPFDAVLPRLTDLPAFVAIGLLGGGAQIFLTRAYGMAPASVIAPFEYATLIFALMLGLALWGELPTAIGIAGIMLIVCSNLFLAVHEERRRSAPPACTRKQAHKEQIDHDKPGDVGFTKEDSRGSHV